MISFSAYLSFVLVFQGFGSQAKNLFIGSIPVILLIKIVIFYISGLYKGYWEFSSLEEFFKILGVVFLSSSILALLIAQVYGMNTFGGLSFFVLDFYLLLTLVSAFRGSYRVLNNYYHKRIAQKSIKVLIYGAGYRGSTVIKEIRHNGSYVFSPVGFIDDDPNKKGRMMHGCPILGSIEDLDKITTKNEISEIIISTAKIGKDRIRRLTEFCKDKGIIIRQFEYRFYEFS